MKTDYNGWTNYATWRVNLEMFDGINPNDYWIMDAADIETTLPGMLKNWVIEVIENQSKGIAKDYALAFLSDVDWQEIAKHFIDEREEQNV